jgi:hypothetical protein
MSLNAVVPSDWVEWQADAIGKISLQTPCWINCYDAQIFIVDQMWFYYNSQLKLLLNASSFHYEIWNAYVTQPKTILYFYSIVSAID